LILFYPLTISGYREYSVTIIAERGGDRMKSWTVRIPDEVLEWLREKAARETIKRKKSFSMNSLAIEIFTKAMETDRKKGGE